MAAEFNSSSAMHASPVSSHGEVDVNVRSDDQLLIPMGTNNSMPLADKPYDPPTLPEEYNAYNFGLTDTAKLLRSKVRPTRRNYVTMFFRIRRRQYEMLLWQLLTSGVLTKENMYSPEFLPFWTISVRMRIRVNFPMGRVMETIRQRIGVYSPGLRFCLDGFFGMVSYSDIFGTTNDSCPWMEISNNSTVESLRLADGDSIFVSVASAGQIQNVAAWRKRHVNDDALRDANAAASVSPTPTRADDEAEETPVVG